MNKEHNFRELGGIVTENGRTVKKGCFFRSGAPGYMSEEELQEVFSHNIRHIIDLRSTFEKERLEDPEIPGAQYHHMNAMARPDGKEVDLSPKGISHNVFTKETGDKFLHHFYGTLPFSPAYRRIFDLIKADEVPIMFHCSAGKDRTGIAALLILLVLGCSEETALEDYMLTNDYRSESIRALLDQHRAHIEKDPALAEALTGICGVNRQAAEYSIQRIKEAYGTYENYYQEVLGLTKEDIEELRRKYTEKADGTESVSEQK